jgi:hypothetical protein
VGVRHPHGLDKGRRVHINKKTTMLILNGKFKWNPFFSDASFQNLPCFLNAIEMPYLPPPLTSSASTGGACYEKKASTRGGVNDKSWFLMRNMSI